MCSRPNSNDCSNSHVYSPQGPNPKRDVFGLKASRIGNIVRLKTKGHAHSQPNCCALFIRCSLTHFAKGTVPKTNQQSVPKHLSSTSVQVFYLVLSQPQMSIISSVLYLFVFYPQLTNPNSMFRSIPIKCVLNPLFNPNVPVPIPNCLVLSYLVSKLQVALARGLLLHFVQSLIKYTFGLKASLGIYRSFKHQR